VLLNGMRVVFDEKVALYPVTLEPDTPNLLKIENRKERNKNDRG
jgi:hypothetical protein